VIAAIVFDLDGVLIDSEQVWDDVRERLARERSGRWHPGAQRDMMGMSSPEWSRYMHERIGLAETPAEINELVVARMLERYAAGPPWLPGALEAVRRAAARYPLGLASSSNRVLIEQVLEAGGIAALFAAVVSSEEVARGKPAPDVYLEAARRLGVAAAACVAVEDSHSGIRSAKDAGMRCIAIPNAHFPPGPALAEADLVVAGVGELDFARPELLAALAAAAPSAPPAGSGEQRGGDERPDASPAGA
jgi:HAD superfamily hydrolase (TIGR01509 family)